MKLPRQINRAARRPDWQAARTGQSVLEYALVIAILAVGCIVSVAFARDSFRALYVAHQAPLSDSVSASGDINGKRIDLTRAPGMRYYMAWITQLPPVQGGVSKAKISEFIVRR